MFLADLALASHLSLPARQGACHWILTSSSLPVYSIQDMAYWQPQWRPAHVQLVQRLTARSSDPDRFDAFAKRGYFDKFQGNMQSYLGIAPSQISIYQVRRLYAKWECHSSCQHMLVLSCPQHANYSSTVSSERLAHLRLLQLIWAVHFGRLIRLHPQRSCVHLGSILISPVPYATDEPCSVLDHALV